jgi:SAM-dependent methyltransferase
MGSPARCCLLMLAKLLAKQLGRPSGLPGRLILAPLWNRRNSTLNDVAFESLALHPRERVLEVGFGGGYLLGRMADVLTEGFLAGVDSSPAMVAFCEKRQRSRIEAGKLELRCARAEALPYPAAYFTKACTVNSIFYWQDASRAISELGRVLDEGGQLVICFTCKGSIEGRAFARQGLALYEAEDVQSMAKTAGFDIIDVTRASDRHREFVCLTGKR